MVGEHDLCGGFARFDGAHEAPIGRVDVAFGNQIVEVDRAPPVLFADEHDGNRLHLVRLDQVQRFEQLIERPESAGEGDQRPCTQQKVHLAQGKVVEAQRQVRRDIGIRQLLGRQPDVEPDTRCASLERAAIRGLHDAGATPGDDDEMVAVALLWLLRQDVRELPRLGIEAAQVQIPSRPRQARAVDVTAVLQRIEGELRDIGGFDARSAEYDDG